MIINFEAG